MAKRIVFTRADGGVSVIGMAPQHVAEHFAGDEDAAIAAELLKPKVIPPDATNVEVMEEELIPPHDLFRDDWRRVGMGPPEVNMPAARRRHIERIAESRRRGAKKLQEREEELRLAGDTTKAAAVAVELTKVLGVGKNSVVSQVAAATTPTELEAVWPAALGKFKDA